MIGKAFDRPQEGIPTPGATYKEPCARAETVGQDIQPDGINLQLVRLRDKVTVLHEMFTNLEQKTSSICKPMPCKVQCEKDSPDGSEMQRFLKEQNQRLDSLLERIEFMIESIDL